MSSHLLTINLLIMEMKSYCYTFFLVIMNSNDDLKMTSKFASVEQTYCLFDLYVHMFHIFLDLLNSKYPESRFGKIRIQEILLQCACIPGDKPFW